ncbi:hypothetical protein [Bacillus sp. V5-8f]|uniref:hypothetical protein n=1 Tax=Bacillus sp. V5-8f TaxID=2053044 RepID=UPI000C77EB14|nr:hypothetical protein [Bacillus sp. V5-8f]PLT34074.1 hypothetical protein CUU64_10745 [Bacillus sp. V5-8f]
MGDVKASTPWFNKDPIRIGPDEVRTKGIGIEKSFPVEINGVICHAGIGFVNILKDDQTVVTIMTERINSITWEDPGCQPGGDCHKMDSRHINHFQNIDGQKFSHAHACHDLCPCCGRQHNDCRHPDFIYIRDQVIPFCDDRIQLRLAGLTDSVNFELLSHKGCRVFLDVS